MDFGPKFTLVREGTLLADIAARARTHARAQTSGVRTSRHGGQASLHRQGAPLAPSTLAKQASTGTSAVTQQAKVRASYARSLDTALRRARAARKPEEDLRRLLRRRPVEGRRQSRRGPAAPSAAHR